VREIADATEALIAACRAAADPVPSHQREFKYLLPGGRRPLRRRAPRTRGVLQQHAMRQTKRRPCPRSFRLMPRRRVRAPQAQDSSR
jgi:hypothetical protein